MCIRWSVSCDCVKGSRMKASCLELALEGERLCKKGDYSSSVPFFEAAMQVGTEDLLVLSAIYSQLGNAYFHLCDYTKALEFHHHDLTLTRTTGDILGEAKASGNLGNTLKLLGHFDEAIVFCQRHLDICTDVGDKVGQARALYNFGNVYHAKGKSACSNDSDPGNFPEEATAALNKAAEFYKENLHILKEMGDRAAQGRTYGNLGNTQYLLSNFCNAVASHQQRLLIAKELNDLAAERRAYCNLGNAYIFLGELEKAAEHYKKALQLARQLRDQAVEAQVCYSLGNTYTLLQDYERAIDYHLKHLIIAQDLGDSVGEGRSCWSLGNAHTALGNHDQAMHFAERHREISNKTGDCCGELTARMNVSDLQSVLALSYSTNNSVLSENKEINYNLHGARPRMSRRFSMENLELMTLAPEKLKKWGTEVLCMQPKAKFSSKFFFMNRLRGKNSSSSSKQKQPTQKCVNADMLGNESFLDLLSRIQENRMDDQRCSIQKVLGHQSNTISDPSSSCSSQPTNMKKSFSESAVSQGQDTVLGIVATVESRRLEDQRAVGSEPVLCKFQTNPKSSRQTVLSQFMTNLDPSEPDDCFFDMLLKSQGSRLNDQRCAPPPALIHQPTVPDEDFLSLIIRSQAKRINEQRAALPSID
ncbi:G-protein-signaling modulator 2-like isoform X2 [Silurus meridionalis]|uniref:G-protein-signaling modulator 2-like isoform X2 n=1 Tax=Silurus meridionalis TaxID=175797 RepID=UPI001EEA127E|nr:G-protein-signaling modulator 2-like isoform X2 [Silurus meridionalis]